MDPTACLSEMLDALSRLEENADDTDARSDACERCSDLLQWLKGYGAPPNVTNACEPFVELGEG